MAKYELLVGAQEFWRRLERDIQSSKRRVLIQAMTFEGDSVGIDVVNALSGSGASDRRILVDFYTHYVVNDRFLNLPRNLRDPNLQAEVKQTREMFLALKIEGVGVKFTNPPGLLLYRFAARNHKKLMVVDNAAYLGGFNFSEHNFEWHDMMVRVEDADIADFVATDFDMTYDSRSVFRKQEFDGAALYSLDGRHNAMRYGEVLDILGAAKSSIIVISPYLTFPFTDVLRRAKERGVQVSALSAKENNKAAVQHYQLWHAKKLGIELKLSEGMSHLKAILVDESRLLLGSPNFDFVSFHSQEEILAAFEDEVLIEQFRSRVLNPMLDRSCSLDAVETSDAKGLRSYMGLKIAELVSRLSKRAKRCSIDWPVA